MSKVLEFSERETEILDMLANDADNKKIMAALNIADTTLSTLMDRLKTRLGQKNREALVTWAKKNRSGE